METLAKLLSRFPYINHHDRLTQQENNNLMNHFSPGRNALPEHFVFTLAIGVDTKDPTANALRERYNELIVEQGIRQPWGGSDFADDELKGIRQMLVDMAQDLENNAVHFIRIIEPINPYGTNWRAYLPARVQGMLSNNTDDPRFLEEQAHVANTMANAFAKSLEEHGHKPATAAARNLSPSPPPAPAAVRNLSHPPPQAEGSNLDEPDDLIGGYKKSYGKKKKTKKTRRKTKNMRRKSKTKTKTKKKNTRKKKHYKKRKSKTHKKR